MKRETLEALLMDRELGELTCETIELLDAYLAQNPSPAEEARDLARAIAVARQSMAANESAVVPPFESIALVLRRDQGRINLRRRALVVLQVAAVLALGIGLGWSWPRPAANSHSVVRVMPIDAPRIETPGAFWSHENFVPSSVELASTPERGVGRHRLEWESPLKKPRIHRIP